ncbi:MAG: glutaminase [Bacteroidota bacterium]
MKLNPEFALASLKEAFHENESIVGGKKASYIRTLLRLPEVRYASLWLREFPCQLLTYGKSPGLVPIESAIKPFGALAAMEKNRNAYMDIFQHHYKWRSPYAFNEFPELVEGKLPDPLGNCGAMVTHKFISHSEVYKLFGRLTGFYPMTDTETYLEEVRTADTNRERLKELLEKGFIETNIDLEHILQEYTMSCSLLTTVEQLVYAARILANFGQDPITGETILTPINVASVLGWMSRNGSYDDPGHVLLQQLRALKPSVSGLILLIVPGILSLVLYDPFLNDYGNSKWGMAMVRTLEKKWLG